MRIVFGLMWAVDAAFKWSPAFVDHLGGYLSTAGQPAWVAHYISGWARVVGHDPRLFAYGLAVAESLLALALITGCATKIACGAGTVLSLIIWSTAEGFGGPYGPGSTDVGTSAAYVLVFILLWWSDAGNAFSIDVLRRSRSPRRVSRRLVAAIVAVTAVVGLLVTSAVIVSWGQVAPSTSMDGGQMQMAPGGQDDH
ncbi:MAG TPA: hypothetical protein VGG09_07540 [Acidimicrobiales bacterium]